MNEDNDDNDDNRDNDDTEDNEDNENKTSDQSDGVMRRHDLTRKKDNGKDKYNDKDPTKIDYDNDHDI